MSKKSKDSKRVQKSGKEFPIAMDTAALAGEIRRGNTMALAKGITLIESNNFQHSVLANELIEHCISSSPSSIRIGITGVPGVGKSTFIEAFGTRLTSMGKKVAVLAVDPSSTISKGSILGDKTRMPTLAVNPKAFIRPSPAGTSLGGVARKTREAIILCEAAGFDVVLVETVGVGQSEVTVHSMVDFFLLLKITGAGDELQGIKRGIIEMADAIVITKADGDNMAQAAHTKSEFQRALHLYPPKPNGWTPIVMTASALDGSGIDAILDVVFTYQEHTKKNKHFEAKRANQNTSWMEQAVFSMLQDEFLEQESIQKLLPHYKEKVASNKLSSFRAAEELLKAYRKGSK